MLNSTPGANTGAQGSGGAMPGALGENQKVVNTWPNHVRDAGGPALRGAGSLPSQGGAFGAPKLMSQKMDLQPESSLTRKHVRF